MAFNINFHKTQYRISFLKINYFNIKKEVLNL